MRVIAVHAHDDIVGAGQFGRTFKQISARFTEAAVDAVGDGLNRVGLCILGDQLGGAVATAVVADDDPIVESGAPRCGIDLWNERRQGIFFVIGGQENVEHGASQAVRFIHCGQAQIF